MEIMKNGKMGYRIVIFTLAGGYKVIGSTGINGTDGEEITKGYWACSTVNTKINKLSKEMRIPKYNHAKHYKYIVA